jgi:RNA polymerase sigma-70 factor (ECF subfamily)
MSTVNPALQAVESTNEYDEKAVLARAKNGDAEAVDMLVRRYLKDVYAVSSRLLADRDHAQDAAQDALMNALKGLRRFRGESSFRTWLMRITVNSARTVVRRKARRREVSLEIVTESAADVPDAATLAMRNDEASRALVALEKLPDKQRMAVSLRINQGLNYQEIGAVLNCSEGAARVNYHLGVKRLRELMK